LSFTPEAQHRTSGRGLALSKVLRTIDRTSGFESRSRHVYVSAIFSVKVEDLAMSSIPRPRGPTKMSERVHNFRS